MHPKAPVHSAQAPAAQLATCDVLSGYSLIVQGIPVDETVTQCTLQTHRDLHPALENLEKITLIANLSRVKKAPTP